MGLISLTAHVLLFTAINKVIPQVCRRMKYYRLTKTVKEIYGLAQAAVHCICTIGKKTALSISPQASLPMISGIMLSVMYVQTIAVKSGSLILKELIFLIP